MFEYSRAFYGTYKITEKSFFLNSQNLFRDDANKFTLLI